MVWKFNPFTGTLDQTGTGASTLDALTDVNVTEGAGIDGYSLTWDNATSKWVATSVGTSASAGGSSSQLQYNAAGSLGGISGATSDGTSITVADGDLKLSGATSGTQTLKAAAIASTYVITLPAATDTLVGLATTDTLTNKTLTTPVLNGTITGTGVDTAATASTLVQRDADKNIFVNNFFANATNTTSAGGTTVLTIASSRFQDLTGSSNQTYQLPDATTLTEGHVFSFNNNSSGSLIIKNAGSTTLYTAPAGGYVICNLLDNGTANGSWDFHAQPPSVVTWSSGTGGLIFNTALTTTPQILSGASSSTSPSFIPQRGASTTGFGGDGTNLYATIAGTAKLTISSTGASVETTGVFTTGTIELGAATDTTISRVSAGKIAVEGVNVVTISSTDTLTNKDLTSGTNTFPTFNQNTTGSAAKWTTARNLAGNSVDGSTNVAFANKFIVQGTTDSGLSGAQFLGSLATGILKNTTTTGVLSIAVAGDFPTLNQNTTGSAATLTTSRTLWGQSFNGSANVTGDFTLSAGDHIVPTVPTSDGTATGPVTAEFNCGYTSSAVGDLVYLDSSATWQKVDASAASTSSGLLGIALEVKASGAALKVALPGSFVYTTAFPTFTIGAPIYASETAGAVTLTQPTTTDAVIRVIGHGIHADKMYFNPDNAYITHT